MQKLLYLFINLIIINLISGNISSLEGKTNNLKRKESIFAKIIGGQPVPVESYPFTVQLFNFGALCSGTIIHSWTVLTSAHCMDLNQDTNEMRIQTGSRYVYDFDSTMYKVLSFVIHDNYNNEAQFSNDIALIFVEKPIQLGIKTQKAVLVDNDKWMNHNEKEFIVTGWGWTQYGGPVSELGLMMTHLNYVPRDECGKLHQLKLTSDMFCLYGNGTRDTCKGDSGGGVIWNGMIVGITSHGDGCAKKGKPSIYTNVFLFRDWIREEIEKFLFKYCNQKEKQSIRKNKLLIS
ncbi:hypothetical protein K1T71_002746 [Dendrolimus kikuchii]|uniref:Uncharacterized protein n=1 Tax=Dendrolimus kikuchii TaxID=765133 RepID=A0ACC1DDJ8_9NEOP|nr:hypothetical protein K1T71_002746 [Dendrolimus kikuchii]